MKREKTKITVELAKPRNVVALAMLDRNGVFKPRQVARVNSYQRQPKHKGRNYE
jgi:hypothetical protein